MTNDQYRQFLIDGERIGAHYSLSVPHRGPLGQSGVHLGKHAGSSLEFKDHRDYQPGDDIRRIDWNAYARTDRLTVKLFREEISPHLDIVIDGSRSMALEGTMKVQATVGIAAVFAQAASNAGFSHSAWMTRGACQRVGNGTQRPSIWEDIDFESRGNPMDSFTSLSPAWRRQGIRVLLSDLLWMGTPLQTLQVLARGAAAVVVVQVLAKADVEPPRFGSVRLVDSETDAVQEIFVDASAVKRYQDSLARHQENWHAACRQVGGVMVTLVAESVFETWQLKELVRANVLEAI
jgi:uncharacterized protein (DUF58 family)